MKRAWNDPLDIDYDQKQRKNEESYSDLEDPLNTSSEIDTEIQSKKQSPEWILLIC